MDLHSGRWLARTQKGVDVRDYSKAYEAIKELYPRCSLCGGRLYGSFEDHRWSCPRFDRAIEDDKQKERE